MPKVQASCQVCGKPIEFFPSAKRRFCSNSCSSYFNGKERAARGIVNVPGVPRTGQTIPCATCGQPFYAQAWELANGRRFCSAACRSAADRKPRTERACEYCGKVMLLKPSAVANGRRFCSKRCDNLGRTQSWTLLDRSYNGMPVKQDPKGYIWVWAPGRGCKQYGGWYPEHRLIIEEMLGRRLTRDEHVHHKGTLYPEQDPRNKADNRPENLQVLMWLDHAALSLQEHRDFLKREAEELAEYRRRFGPLTPPL